MWQRKTQYKSAAYLTTLLLTSASLTATFRFAPNIFQPLMAQTVELTKSAFPLPTSVESGTTVRLDGSSSMAGINNSLKQAFETKFAGSTVEVTNNGTSAAIKSLESGQIDLAGIGRGLTKSELDKGLRQSLLRREKIAIIVGENNSFTGSLTDEQFAKIFRGEITNWSQIGGKPGAIRFIDRPVSSDTREAFRNYPVFQGAKFETGENAVTLEQDDTAELVKALGNDGISYVIASQAQEIPGIRVLKMHKILPDDPRYPYSQPLVYAYKENPSSGVKSFLGFAGAEPGTEAVEASLSSDAKTIAQAIANPEASANSPTPNTTANADSTDTSDANSASGENLQAEDSTVGTSASNAENQQTANNNTAGNSAGNDEGGSNWLWWLAPIALGLGGGGLLWLLTKGARPQNENNLTPAAANGDLDSSSPSMNLNSGVSAAATGSIDSATLAATNTIDDAKAENTLGTAGDALPGGIAATAGAAAVGAGLWERLTQRKENPDANSKDTSELGAALDGVAPQQEQKQENNPDNPTETEHLESNTDVENNTNPSDRNLVEQIGTAGLAAGATVLGTGLWNRLTKRDDTPNPDSQTSPTDDIREDSQVAAKNNLSQPSPTVTPEYLTPLPDVWDEPSETDADTNTVSNSAVPGVASAGQSLWDNLAETSPANVGNVETSNLDIDTPETHIPPTNDLDVAVDPLQTAIDQIPLPTVQASSADVAEVATPDHLETGAAVLAGGVAAAGLTGAFSNPEQNPPQTEASPDTDIESNPVTTMGDSQNQTEISATESSQLEVTGDTSPSTFDPNNAELNPATSHIQLTPRTPKWAYVTWNIPDNERHSLQQQGASQLTLRLYDVTDIDLSYQSPQLVQQYECEEAICNRFIAIPTSDRDYMAEIGYNTDDERWLLLARSPIVRVFRRSHQEFWFEADAELIIHGATQPGSTVKIGGHSVKVKQDGTFHLRMPFTEEILDYTMTSVSENGEQAKTIHMHFAQNDNQQASS